MRHRHFSNSFKRSRTDQHDSSHTPVEQSYTRTVGPLPERAVAPGNGPVDHISRNTSLAPASPAGHIHYSNYNIPRTRDAEAGLSNGTTGIGKRKRADISGSCAGSSSSSSQMPAAYYCPSVPPYRNVRRRSTLELEPSHTSRHYQSTTHSANHSAPVQPAGLDASGVQWNLDSRYAASSHRRMSPPDFYGSNQFHVGGSSGGSLFSRRVSSSQYLHAQSMTRRIPSSYGNGPSHTHHAHGGTSRWRGSYRSGRPRITVERSQSVIDRMEARAQTIMMVDRASFYGSSRNFLDEYRDLRLDIDSMSYEELLNLEERMGTVSTGLSEDGMSKCLKEKVYSSSHQNRMEVSCPICLEEYKNSDKVGMVEKCGHNYHMDCIKKWLLMKKVCPICKSECSNPQPTEG